MRGLGAKEDKFTNKNHYLWKRSHESEEVTVMFGENLKLMHYYSTEVKGTAVTVLKFLRATDTPATLGEQEERFTGQW